VQGLTVQQVAAALANFRKRLQSKQLEVDALSRMRKVAPAVVTQLVPASLVGDELDQGNRELMKTAVDDYLTAKINWLLIDVQEFELQIKALESQQSGLVLAAGSVPGRRPQG
jgi:hypothetical protein